MTTLFIADLHLHREAPDVTQGFLDYLAYRAIGVEALYILGDLFEGWIGDDGCSEFEDRIIAALRTFSDRGSALYVMHGNRDFLLGEDFARRSGAVLLDDPTLIQPDDEVPMLLMHGDSLCTQDEAYMKFRAMTRDPEWQRQTLALPIEQRRALADQLRERSSDANEQKSHEIMDVTPQAVTDIMARCHVRTLIHGHTHRPDVHDLQLPDETMAQRYVLGDWRDDQGWEIRLDGMTMTLERFTLAELPC